MTARGHGSSRPFRTWKGREPFEIFPGVRVHAIGGEQVLLCHVTYQPGTTVRRHSHAHTEQVMWVLDGGLRMTVGDETASLGPGDVVVVNRQVEHELESPTGCTFLEALAPVPLDHVGERDEDLVLGPDGGALHVER
jgi:quercetin dioxygenase-like cupin family protein